MVLRASLIVLAASLASTLATPAQLKPANRDVVFSAIPVNPREWKRVPEPLTFGEASFPVVLETPRFLIVAPAKTSDSVLTGYATGLERTCADFMRDVPFFEEVMAGRRMLVFLVSSDELMASLANWYKGEAEKLEWYQTAATVEEKWERMSITSGSLPPELANARSLTHAARVFRVDNYPSARQRDPSWNLRVFFSATSLVSVLLQDVEEDGAWCWGGIRMGLAYHREWRATGRMEAGPQMSTGRELEGFGRGKSWVASVKALVKDGARPSLTEVLTRKAEDCHPRDLGFSWSIIRFLLSTPDGRKGLDTAFRDVRKTAKCSDAHAFATACGFESKDAFEDAWRTYVLSGSFR